MADTYVVKSGDTLGGIASKTGVSLSTIKKLNPQLERGKNFNLIRPGDVVGLVAIGETPTPSPAPTAPSPTPTIPQVPIGNTYVVKTGDTLSAIASRTGVSLTVLKQLNPQLERGRNFNLIRPGDNVNLKAAEPVLPTEPPPTVSPIQEPPPGVQPEEVTPDDTQAIDNIQNLLTSFEDKQDVDDGVETRFEAVTEVTPTVAPTRPDLATTLAEQRQEFGVDPLEDEVVNIDSQIADIEAEFRRATGEERLISKGFRSAVNAKLASEAQDKIDTLNREKRIAVDQLTNKYNAINMAMNFLQQDYNTARDEYEFEFNKALQINEFLLGEEQREENTARANWQVMSSTINSALVSGSLDSFDNLPDNVKLSIQKLEAQAGYPQGFTETVLANITPGKGKPTITTSKDKSQVSYLYPDGTVEVYSTGLTPEVAAGDKAKVFKFTSDDRGRILATGLSSSEITHIENGIREYGIDEVMKAEDFTEEQLAVINQVLSGVTPTQVAKEKEEAEEETKRDWEDQEIKDDLKTQFVRGNTLASIKGSIKRDDDMSDADKARFMELIDEKIPKDWQKKMEDSPDTYYFDRNGRGIVESKRGFDPIVYTFK